MILSKFYCISCGQFKNRLQVKKRDDTRSYWYDCKWCHNQVSYTKDLMAKTLKSVASKNDWSF